VRSPFAWSRRMGAASILFILVAGCSSQTNQRLLRVFFTGVDQTNSPPVVVEPPRPSTNTAAGPVAIVTVPVIYRHQPFLDGKCDACHLAGGSEELRATGSALCLECHQKLIQNAKFLHAPVRDGRCALCHDAHKSPERFLLTRKGQDVCLNCHKMAEMTKVKGHLSMGSAECLSCHDAHRSNEKYLLKTRQ